MASVPAGFGFRALKKEIDSIDTQLDHGYVDVIDPLQSLPPMPSIPSTLPTVREARRVNMKTFALYTSIVINLVLLSFLMAPSGDRNPHGHHHRNQHSMLANTDATSALQKQHKELLLENQHLKQENERLTSFMHAPSSPSSLSLAADPHHHDNVHDYGHDGIGDHESEEEDEEDDEDDDEHDDTAVGPGHDEDHLAMLLSDFGNK
mmetsp:Transcript_27307/g.50982  ORF Transcript_27307/g.50982 Transcript_27307/m.50982 type:complete len:206 (-) Transcript_27307:321-938(-)|eukprot:CAMPEP_0170171940 /NCGR_PEP_ID=MMETSP0040_2-20121228/5146_1 /TAXON_ID=641309 /ORGANISM="Lotharella oceanica, Strain CCMP622" /LENGTH=205 /DNA_ID=CAMNT_0010412303 /DNA_START=41 /DNA_END=658 /DNA_ORIENTATION=-